MSLLRVSCVKLFPYFVITLYMALPDEMVCQFTLSCSTSVGIAVGWTTFTTLATVVVTTVIFLQCWLRYVKWDWCLLLK